MKKLIVLLLAITIVFATCGIACSGGGFDGFLSVNSQTM